jgi:hypothetical protein
MEKFFLKKFSKKGFIGPIGDDLPSLIPIVISLLLFFTIFSITLNAYNSKNSDITKQTLMISASREIKGDSMILSYDQFQERCDRLKLKYYPYNFIMAIYPTGGINPLDNPLENVLDNFKAMEVDSITGEIINRGFIEDQIIGKSGEKYICGYKKKGGNTFSTKTRAYLLRYYPVAVQTTRNMSGEDYVIIVPAVMAVIVWD